MANARSLSQFQEAFSDEASCAAFLFKRRWPEGFVCPACGKRRAAVLKSRPRLHECLDCGRQTSVTAGTVMHRSKLPLTTWFWAAHMMTTHSNGMSALQLQDQLGVTYKTAWLLTQKLRRSMVDPDREPLEGVVEVDQAEIAFREGDTFFEPGNCQQNPGYRSRRGHRTRRKSSQTATQARQISRHALRSHPPRHDRRQLRRLDRSLRERQCEAWGHAAHRRPQILSVSDGLSARSARRRQNGRAHRLAMDSSGIFADEAMEPRDISRRCAASTSTLISTNSCFATTADITDMSPSKRSSGSPPTNSPRAIGDIVRRDNPRKSARRPTTPSPLHIDEPESTG